MNERLNGTRMRVLYERGPGPKGPVVYWMSRDQRVADNWALLYAQAEALRRKVPVYVVFCLVTSFLGATKRSFSFMLKGLVSVEQELKEKRIPFYCEMGDPAYCIPRFVARVSAGLLITDFDPLKIKRQWKEKVGRAVTVSFYEVDAHNIVPCWVASDKAEYGAYTLRPKLHRVFAAYCTNIPRVKRHPYLQMFKKNPFPWKKAMVQIDACHGNVFGINSVSGEKEARRQMRTFIKKRLNRYDEARNDPVQEGQSGLSPYLHFGQLAPQRVAYEVIKSPLPMKKKEGFLEELVIRRELADNFCFYNEQYDSCAGFPFWARKTLDEHRGDKRRYVYTQRKLENAETHDPLWNAAQKEMVVTGTMHGYLRMYWAKKILEWTRTPEGALAIATFLNDTYELDGRDPNGYAGLAWSIGGVHDRAWPERNIFGKIRYMNDAGCKRKFAVTEYIQRVKQL